MSLIVIRDTREQYEPTWSDDVDGEERVGLPYGDYSAVGLTDIVSLEVKWSLDDLATCVGRERERFDTMLRGLRRYPVRALIIAATIDDVRAHNYVSKVTPNAIMASTWAWGADYQIPTFWCRNAAGATTVIEWFLRRTIEHHERGEYELEKAENRSVVGEIVEAVNKELWMQFLLAGIANPPDHWTDMDRHTMAARLRSIADELEPQSEPVRSYHDVLVEQGRA